MLTRGIYFLTGGLLVMSLAVNGAHAGNITAIWANDGGDKVTQDELRATRRTSVNNTVWNGQRVYVFGARNEVVGFNMILEAGSHSATQVTVRLPRLEGPMTLASVPATGNGVFDWTQRPIELFYVRYQPINGLSMVSYGTYDERHVPKRFRRPWNGDGKGSGGWKDRPDRDKYYPEIAVPLELVPPFTIEAGKNQSVWVDVYIPKSAPPGLYKGDLEIQEAGFPLVRVPVQLWVSSLTLPDLPTAKTMLYFSSSNISRRYFGSTTAGTQARRVRDRHFMLAHRHKISLIGDASGDDCNSTADEPCPEWIPRLNGSLFTPTHGYDGPGVNTGNNVYSIGTYGNWKWKNGSQADMHRHADAWVNWFSRNAPSTEYFLYLADESSDTRQLETWSQWLKNNPGPGRELKSLATLPLPTAAASVPSLDIPASTLTAGDPNAWQPLSERYTSDGRRRFYMYNGHRPATGSFATEDDGVALRQLAWAQYKKKIHRWFFWESTYYNNYQGNTKEFNIFKAAQAFGNSSSMDAVLGRTGWNYSNGDGVLFYPGTDRLFPADSYGVEGPFASLRLKAWRRGLQDADYLALAAAVNPEATAQIINSLLPKTLWEVGVSDPKDPTWVRSDIHWPTNPDQWETARAQLTALVSGVNPLSPTVRAGGFFNNVRAYPNPWRNDRHAGTQVTLANVPPGTTAKIFTVSAHLVKNLPESSNGILTWDLTNNSGENVASGLYIYLLKAGGETARGKLAVIR
jgi:hypothetical protein